MRLARSSGHGTVVLDGRRRETRSSLRFPPSLPYTSGGNYSFMNNRASVTVSSGNGGIWDTFLFLYVLIVLRAELRRVPT